MTQSQSGSFLEAGANVHEITSLLCVTLPVLHEMLHKSLAWACPALTWPEEWLIYLMAAECLFSVLLEALQDWLEHCIGIPLG